MANIDEYCDYLIRSGSNAAAKSYRGALNGFETWLEPKGRSLDDFTFQDAEMYMKEGFNSPRTANNLKIAVVGYLRYKFTTMRFDDPNYTMVKQKFDQMRLLRNRKSIRKYEKVSLEVDELKEFLKAVGEASPGPMVALATMFAYWGTRPIELESNIARADINWEERSMIIETAKTKQPRYLCWPESLDFFVKVIYNGAPFPYAGEYFTKTLKYQQEKKKDIFKNEVIVTAKTFRKTFQTQERLLGVPDILIDAVMGHENSGSKMGNIYFDCTSKEFMRQIKEFMTSDQHYMIKAGIVK